MAAWFSFRYPSLSAQLLTHWWPLADRPCSSMCSPFTFGDTYACFIICQMRIAMSLPCGVMDSWNQGSKYTHSTWSQHGLKKRWLFVCIGSGNLVLFSRSGIWDSNRLWLLLEVYNHRVVWVHWVWVKVCVALVFIFLPLSSPHISFKDSRSFYHLWRRHCVEGMDLSGFPFGVWRSFLEGHCLISVTGALR